MSRRDQYGIFKRCRAFPERVGPRILSLESVDYFGTSEHFSGRKKEESLWAKLQRNFDGEANWSGVANESCDKHAVFLGNDQNDVSCSSRFCSLVMMKFLSNQGPWVYLSRVLNQFKQIVKYDIKSKYPEEYSILYKRRTWKTFSEEILFRAELIASILLI